MVERTAIHLKDSEPVLSARLQALTTHAQGWHKQEEAASKRCAQHVEADNCIP